MQNALVVVTLEDVHNVVVSIVADQAECDRVHIADTTKFVDDLSFDSLDKVDILVEIEREFPGVKFDWEVGEQLQAVNQLVAYIWTHRDQIDLQSLHPFNWLHDQQSA